MIALVSFFTLVFFGGTAAGDEIPFRLLTEGDFLAKSPPPEVVWRSGGLEAASCLQIVWPAGQSLAFSERSVGGATRAVTVTLVRPRFAAVFDRSCSWWAPDPKDPAYALLHEQVHFAISEHAARELTRRLADPSQAIRARGASKQEAEARLQERLHTLANSAKRKASAEHKAFDSAARADRSVETQQLTPPRSRPVESW